MALASNLTVNIGLRFEWENGIAEDNGELIVDFDPNATLAISDLAEAAYARAPIPQLAPADFHVRGGSVYASDPGQDGKVWRPQAMWMPRVSAVYKLGEKTVLKGGYGDLLRHAQCRRLQPEQRRLQRHDDQHEQHGLRPDVPARQSVCGDLGISDPFPVRADGTRFDEPTGATLGVDTIAGSSLHDPEPGTTSTPASSGGGSASSGSWRGTSRWKWPTTAPTRIGVEISIRQDYLPQQYWIPGSLNARDTAAQACPRRPT